MNGAAILTCEYHARGLCHSCTEIGVPQERQLDKKTLAARDLLRDVVPASSWLPPATGPVSGFRNKAKLAVGGTTERPTLGLSDATGRHVDLRECGLHERANWEIIPDLAGFITLTRLVPYDVAARNGQLKFVIVTANPAGELMLRFVVRQRSDADAIRRHLPALLGRLPQVVSVSINLHPEHKAVIEGETEVHLHGPEFFPFPMRDRTLYLHHRSFFQTNTGIAQQLYDQAARWANELRVTSVLDLYCGVGGFAVHLASPGRTVHGIEIEPDAVEAARRSAAHLPGDMGPVTFAADDATQALAHERDLVIVNPPRRGLGEQLCSTLEASRTPHILYSSCHPASLAEDLRRMPSYAPIAARLFDMFPQTAHSEVAVLLRRV